MQPGQSVGQYEILEVLGRGGMGVVYRARDTRLDRIVALKFLPSHLSSDQESKQRFIREAKAASALDHANICTIHDIAETEGGELYIVMAHYAGRTLRERLDDEEWPVERSMDVGLQLGRALERAHEAGIVHRDLKPANVMLTDRGEVKLLDFGVAKLASGDHLTRTGSTLGTLSYMSPEQLSGEGADHRSDLWALGVILYEMLAGRQPFGAGQEAAVMYAIVSEQPPPLTEVRADVPPELAGLVAACLSKDRGQRPSGAGEVCAVLSRTLGLGGRHSEGPDGALVTARPEVSGLPRTSSVAGSTTTATRFRRRVLVAAIPTVLAVIAAFYWTKGPGGGSSMISTGRSENLLAVVPFTVRGAPEFAYLGEGIVDLMSAKLDGAGSLSTVNPRVVIAMINQEGLDVSDPQSGLQVASRVGAGRYVTGDLLEVGGRVTLTAYLHDTAGAEVPLQQASAEGQAGELFDIVDGLVADLLAGSMSGPTDRLQKLAVATSHSLEATKEYLRGERLLRQGRYREAGAAYDVAVTLDPEFALAHYRKSLAADWTDAYDVRSSAERALELAEHLSPRDRNLLSALLLRRTGQNRRAEQAYRAHLHTYPDDVEALLQLGEVLFHDNPRWGVDMREALEPFSKAVELEPVNSNARIHLARLYALMGDLEALRATADVFAAESSGSERSVEVDAIYAAATGDTARMRTVTDRIRESPSYFAFYAAHGVDRFVRDAHTALRILDESGYSDDLLLGTRANLLVAQGRYQGFRELVEGIPGGRTPTWDLYAAFILTSGTIQVAPDRLESLLERVRAIDPAESLETAWLPPYEDLTEAYARFERDYHEALLLIHLGRMEEAREAMAEMEGVGDLPGLGSIATDGVVGLQAEIHLQAGDSARALEALRSLSFDVTHAASVRPLPDQARARLLLAELEWRLGDPQVAEALLRGLDESWGLWDTPFRPQAYRMLGEIAESQGRSADAARYYDLLVRLWARCDPELVPEREEIQARLERVRGG